jgi:endonuclease/exonuclease/phosphatase (EEP) superfamily protein YafD
VTAPSRTHRLRHVVLVAAAAALPWAWYLVRDLGWLAEPFAVGFPLVAGLLIVLLGLAAFGTRRVAPIVVALSVLILAAVVTVAPRMPVRTPQPAPGLQIVSANVFEMNKDPAAAAAALARTDADVVVAVETSPGFGGMLASKDTVRPFQTNDHKTVIRSRFPIESAPIPPSVPRSRALRAIVQGPAGPFVLYAIHALNPAYESTFAEQLNFVDRLRRAALAEIMPVVIAGDFNMSDRQLGYRMMTESFLDAGRAGWAADTFDHAFWRVLLLRIDYVFVEPTWCAADARRLDVPGSDHQAVEATIGPCPG